MMEMKSRKRMVGRKSKRKVSLLINQSRLILIAASSAAPSPLPVTPADSKGDVKPKKEDETPGASSSRRTSPKEEDGVLSTIDDTLTKPRTAETDGVAKNMRVEGGDDTTRDKCAVMMYNALSIDSRAGMSSLSMPGKVTDGIESRILKERAFAIEKAVFMSHEGSTGNDYRASESPPIQLGQS
jgi:hypothetical protein